MAEPSNQPLFFKNPIPLMKDRHAKAGLKKAMDYKFAKLTNSIPLNAEEFVEASKYYPIAFSEANNLPVAIVGIKNNVNLFVDQKNSWAKGRYIPAYARAYPFAFTVKEGGDGDKKLILCVDEGSARFMKLAKKEDYPFFNNGEASNLTKNALNFCQQFYNDSMVTNIFCKFLLDNNLLTSKQVSFTIKGQAKPVALGGFKVIDEQKLKNASPDILQFCAQNGYLSLMYNQISSLSNFAKFIDLIK